MTDLYRLSDDDSDSHDSDDDDSKSVSSSDSNFHENRIAAIIKSKKISDTHMMIVSRVTPNSHSWCVSEHTRADFYIFPLLEDATRDDYPKIYMFRDINSDEDHYYCSGTDSLCDDTYVWWDVVSNKSLRKHNLKDIIFDKNKYYKSKKTRSTIQHMDLSELTPRFY